MMTEIQPLKTDQIDASYDPDEKLLLVKYHGLLSPDVTNQFYAWLIPSMQANPHLVTEARGSIYDFREVQDFQASNITAARRQSSAATQSADIRDHPVALIVESALQERMVHSMMRLTEQLDRKRIVHSVEEAKEFIASWHEKHDA